MKMGSNKMKIKILLIYRSYFRRFGLTVLLHLHFRLIMILSLLVKLRCSSFSIKEVTHAIGSIA
jgi:hypothetical protein